jgi:hypothetical protein
VNDSISIFDLLIKFPEGSFRERNLVLACIVFVSHEVLARDPTYPERDGSYSLNIGNLGSGFTEHVECTGNTTQLECPFKSTGPEHCEA